MAKSKNASEKRTISNGAPVEQSEAERQAGYFLSLSLENVRCFGEKQTLDLSDGNGKPARWTVILGVNGTGKTTILQSLVGFEKVPLPVSSAELGRRGSRIRMLALSQETQDTFSRSGEPEVNWWVKVAASQTLTASPSQVAKYHLFMTIRGSFPSFRYFGGYTSVSPPWCCGYGAGRRMGAAALSDSGPDDAIASLFSDKADLRNPEEWLLQLDYAAVKPSDIQEQQRVRLAQVEELLLSILPEIEEIRLTNSGGTHPIVRAEFKTPYGWVPLRQLGYGYQTLITWVTDLANRMMERYPNSPNPLAEPAFVAVDEIDLHLHPQWQRKLMDFLTQRFPNTQFVVTAHSPLVAQAAADANLAVLRREGDHVVIDNDVENIRNWRIDQILTSDLFGLQSARPPQIERLFVERNGLLDKSKMTAADQRRLKEIEAEIGELPFGETPQERREREEIRKTLDLLMKERQPAP